MVKVNSVRSAEVRRRASALLPVCVVLFLLSVLFQHNSDPILHEMHKGESNTQVYGGLNNEFLLLPLLGFREAAAGLLWVRCDEFFHSGDYDAILPLVRLITWLDPHAENVYITGAWHLAYNFTDSNERSDRRYIAPAQRLLDEGILNNEEISDIKFEKGWQEYDKIHDFNAAEKAFRAAIDTKPNQFNDEWPYGAPLKALHILAHTFEKQGRIPEAIEEWQRALARSTDALAKNKTDYSAHQMQQAEEHNLAENFQRYRDRYTWDYQVRPLKPGEKRPGPFTGHDPTLNDTAYPGVLRPTGSDKTPRPWDVAFQARLEVLRPKVLRVSGLFNSSDGARIDVRISDWNLPKNAEKGPLAAFQVDPNETILIDTVSEKKNSFERELDMSKDPKMYSFSQDYYRIVLSYNPRTTAPNMLDRFGWSGEGLADSNAKHIYLVTDPNLLATKMIEGQGGNGPAWDGKQVPWPVHGQPLRTIRVTYKISRDQVQGLKPITDADIIPSEPGASLTLQP